MRTTGSLCALVLGEIEDASLAVECCLINEADAGEGDGEGSAGDLLLSAEVEELPPDLIFREGV